MLVFIDESGYPRPTDSTMHPVLLGVCIFEKDIKSLTYQIYKLKDTIYSKQDEIKSTQLLRRQIFTKHMTKNKTYTDTLVDIACGFDIRVFAIIMDKPIHKIIVPQDHLPKQYYYLLKKVEYYCEKYNIEKSIFVFDETNEGTDKVISQNFNNFLFRSQLGKKFTRILEMPFFVSSLITPAVQISDIFAGMYVLK